MGIFNIRALLFGAHIGAAEFWKLAYDSIMILGLWDDDVGNLSEPCSMYVSTARFCLTQVLQPECVPLTGVRSSFQGCF